MKSKIFIVDDHQMFRDGIKFLLTNIKNVEVVGEAENGKIFLQAIENQMPDIVLMDISMPEMNGVEATRTAMEKYPDLKIIALSMFGDEEYYYKMIHAGVKGFVLKESGSDELEEAINKVMNNQNFFSQELLNNVIYNIDKEKNQEIEALHKELGLSKREREVLYMLCSGYTTVEIGEKMSISKRTVEGHKQNLLNKTGTKTSVHLIMFAIKNKLVEL
jgi:DNA-binding NarL/FixJ family response regulator